MEAQELRIGNWVGRKKTAWQIIAIHNDKVLCSISDSWFYIHEIEPIPLTADALEKFGFESYYLQDWVGIEMYRKGMFFISLWDERKGYVLINERGKDNYPGMPFIKNVHQLQNLYFALTGEELNINL